MRHNSRRMRVLMAGGLVAWMTVLGFAQQARTPAPVLTAASTDGFETIVKPFLAENCVPCHGNKKHKKDLNFESFESVDVADRAIATAGTRSCGSCAAARCRPTRSRSRPSTSARRSRRWLARELARIDTADAARSRPRDRAPTEPHRIQQHDHAICSASTCIRRTISRRTMPATASTTSPTCCRCRRR